MKRQGRRPEPFEDMFIPEPNSGCWLWLRAVNSRGRAAIKRAGHHLAARYSYTLAKGPIPEGQMLRHSCDNLLCVNPDHLTPGVNQENMDDSVQEYRQRRKLKLTNDQVRALRADPRPYPQLSASYGVCKQEVCRLKLRQRRTYV